VEWATTNCKAAEFLTDCIKEIGTIKDALKAFESCHHYLELEDLEQTGRVFLKRRKIRQTEDTSHIKEESLVDTFWRLDLSRKIVYLNKKDSDKLVSVLKYIQILNQENTAILFMLGVVQTGEGRFSDAINCFESGLKIQPNDSIALYELGNAYLASWQIPEAVLCYEKAICENNSLWYTFNNMGLIKYEIGEVAEAIRYWQTAISIEKKAAEPQLATAIALYSQGNYEQGLVLGEAAIKLDSRYKNLKFLKENLWGDTLLAHARKFLETPRIQSITINSLN
jgi:tetratricopeptide (TPR) repeat protein